MNCGCGRWGLIIHQNANTTLLWWPTVKLCYLIFQAEWSGYKTFNFEFWRPSPGRQIVFVCTCKRDIFFSRQEIHCSLVVIIVIISMGWREHLGSGQWDYYTLSSMTWISSPSASSSRYALERGTLIRQKPCLVTKEGWILLHSKSILNWIQFSNWWKKVIKKS